MAEVPVNINGVIVDYYGRTIMGPVKIVGQLSRSDVGIGGGPILPPPDEKPPGGGEGKPPGIWGGPIDPYPGHPLPEPPQTPPEGPPDENGFIKPPPEGGGWAYHEKYAWMYDPPAGASGPK